MMWFLLGCGVGASLAGLILTSVMRRIQGSYEARIEAREKRIRALADEIERRKADERRDILMKQIQKPLRR